MMFVKAAMRALAIGFIVLFTATIFFIMGMAYGQARSRYAGDVTRMDGGETDGD